MPYLNECHILGHLVKTPELKESANGKKYALFTIAVARPRNQGTDFVSCVAFGRSAEWLAETEKGSLVMAIGPLQSSKTATGGTRWSVLAQQAISFKKPPATKQPTGWEDTGEEVTLDDNDGEDAEW